MKTEHDHNILYLIIAALAIGVIILTVFGIWRHQKTELENRSSQVSTWIENNRNVPTESPEPNIRNILICKNEFEGLRAKIETTGASGMLTMNTHSADGGKCELTVKNMKAPGDLGTIIMSVSADDGNFGITLKMAADQPEQTKLWAETALLYLDAQISEKTAADAVKTALEEGSVSEELFSITVRTDVIIDGGNIIPLKVIEINR